MRELRLFSLLFALTLLLGLGLGAGPSCLGEDPSDEFEALEKASLALHLEPPEPGLGFARPRFRLPMDRASITTALLATKFGRQCHLGDDYYEWNEQNGAGLTVYSVGPGRIVHVYRSLGNYMDVVVVRHPLQSIPGKVEDNEVYGQYSHLAVAVGLKEGQTVAAGTVLGTTTRIKDDFFEPHLHFELKNYAAYLQGPNIPNGFMVSRGYSGEGPDCKNAASSANVYDPAGDGIVHNRFYKTDWLIATLNAAAMGWD
ncbi:MAG: hypothetical protein A2284_07250 [Deltaproteobacteria bacterium RIFOXYA12_FULL_61_11]|nr:MAG: hypothetical protein A2284_07250 [Deltaproteobacteria bacterium RIFOXYA12_FULL_61_11]